MMAAYAVIIIETKRTLQQVLMQLFELFQPICVEL